MELSPDVLLRVYNFRKSKEVQCARIEITIISNFIASLESVLTIFF